MINQTMPFGNVLPFRKVLPNELKSCFLIWKKEKGTRMLLLVSDPHDLLFPRLETVLILFLCSWLANTASGTFVVLITKVDKYRCKDHSFPVKGAGFKLSHLYTPQWIPHDSTLCDDSCLFVSSSGVNGEENCKALSGKLERGTLFVPRLQTQGAVATDGGALLLRAARLLCGSPAPSLHHPHRKALSGLYTHVSRTRCSSDHGKIN